MSIDKVLIAMPAFNEAKVIGKVIKGIKDEGFRDILVVDDCSLDNTYQVAQSSGAKVLRHPINRGGPGAPTMTAIEYARIKGYDYLVLLDSDGQHSPKDISKLLKPAEEHDVVIGSRMIGELKNMPIQRRVANFIGSLITYFFFGLFVRDSQSGFKVLNKKAIERINLTFDTFEFCSEMIGEIHQNGLSFKEVPIEVIYTDHSKSKGQSIPNGFKMVLKFIFRI